MREERMDAWGYKRMGGWTGGWVCVGGRERRKSDKQESQDVDNCSTSVRATWQKDGQLLCRFDMFLLPCWKNKKDQRLGDVHKSPQNQTRGASCG